VHLNPKEVIGKGIIRITPCTKVQQVGMDLTTSEDVVLRKCEWKPVVLNEILQLPSDVFALLISRSTFFRNGIIIMSGVVDPGYMGRPVVTVFSFRDETVIRKNTRVVQAIFFKCDAASLYRGQYLNENL